MNIEYQGSQQMPNIAQNRSDQQVFGSNLYDRSRNAFIRKVYTILAIQFTITTIACAMSMYIPSIAQFQISNIYLAYFCIAAVIVTQIIIYCSEEGRKYPNNMILLSIFTFLESYIVSTICGIVAQEGYSQLVFQAAFSTAGIFFGLTIFAFTTKGDFTTPRGIAIVCLCGLIEFILWVFISPNSFIYDIYLSLGIIVFGIYLVVDTQLIIGGKNGKISMDDYVVAAMFLYIDIIQIFIRILLLLLRSKRR